MESHTLPKFEWSSLQSFLAVVRAGRLTAAARQLGIDHSTLGRRMAALEAALGAKLFDRRPDGYHLTAPGERLFELARTMESDALAVEAELSGTSLRIAGTLRIGAPDGFGTVFLAGRLGRFGIQHPGLELQLVTLPRVFNLSKREADLAIGLARPVEGRLHARKLTDYELGLYGSTAYLAEHPLVHDVADLKAHRAIGYIGDMIYSPELDYLPLVSRDLRPAFTSSNLLVQFQAAVSGVGLCVLPCFMADADGRLRRVLTQSVSLLREFWLITHADMLDLARVRAASGFIAAEVAAARSLFLPPRTTRVMSDVGRISAAP
jgi:DNA-binding transcriptional LysR family regulator